MEDRIGYNHVINTVDIHYDPMNINHNDYIDEPVENFQQISNNDKEMVVVIESTNND